jgi:hypothetical protein
MRTLSTEQAFAEEIKNDVLMSLNRAFGQNFQRQNLIDSIKQEVLMDLNKRHQTRSAYSDQAFIEAVKNEVLAELQRGEQPNLQQPGSVNSRRPAYSDRAIIETIKREVMSQIETEQEVGERTEEVERERGRVTEQNNHRELDPAFIQSVKNDIMAELNMPNYR